ncbi:MAG TPA: hypothetical protein VFU07_09655 [Candidatus Lumbricidophila sp.]|nr:hypothetical protein [Candidatus Lumbricidophila sp.]
MAILTRTWNATTSTSDPTQVMDYRSEMESANIVLDILGGGTAVSHRPAKLRTGTLKFLYTSETLANTCRTLHANPGVWALAYTGKTTIAMNYVVPPGGRITVELDSTTNNAWLVSVDYQEV